MLDFSIPEHLDDIPPPYAAQMAHCREQALAWLAAHDYQLVAPPLVDYLETLTGGDEDLNLHTFKITDTLSGRTLGIRADQTPQIARFD
ncbi:MAG: ATP phosphoribosyltransferase regulatory subunit, partial [Proteobacteria bacterium]|nr:ATP phosphoribosyltransferase regulatory subunit [Pseudomonadota bacterium]